MEDDKNMSAGSEEVLNPIAESVQQEAELTLENIEPDQKEAKGEPPVASQEVGESPSIEEEATSEIEGGEEAHASDDAEVNQTSEVVVPDASSDSDSTIQEASIDSNGSVSQEESVQIENSSESSSIETVQEDQAVVDSETNDTSEEIITSDTTTDGDSTTLSEESSEDASEEEEEDEFDSVDLDGAGKKELLDWIKKVKAEDDIRKVDRLFKDIGSHYESIFGEERNTALEEFKSVEGNDEADFAFNGDELDKEFHALYEAQRIKRSQFFRQLEKQKEENLVQKNEILDMIREVVDGEDQTSFNKVKKLQEDWKKIGQVPGSQNKTLWASYHALMDRFYDQRTIYFELKDLDRKKNLEAKIVLCERAEALGETKDVRYAIVQLNELHEEFKHLGPVPKEDQEPLWQRFKAASDVIYEHRKEYTDQLKEEHKINLEKKNELAVKLEEFASFESDRIKEWNAKSKELLAFQKEWEAIGGVPREKARDINKRFWGTFKKFFSNKNKFFKSLDAQKGDNLKKKQELVERAKELKEQTNWEQTANAFKGLQEEWKNIGQVPEKFRKSVYEEFKNHCDAFFDKRRSQNAEQNKDFILNLEKKKAILDELDAIGESKDLNLDLIYDLADKFSEAGMVPRNAVGKTLNRYEKITKKILELEVIDREDRNDLRIHFDVCKLRNSPHGNQKISRKENTLKRKITGLQNDITNWKTNIDFFGRSANAEQLRSEFQIKINDAEDELADMKQQLRHLH